MSDDFPSENEEYKNQPILSPKLIDEDDVVFTPYDEHHNTNVAIKIEDVPVSTDSPFPTANYDNSHRSAVNSVFGDRIIGTRIPTIAAQFQYGLRADDAVVDVVSTGSVLIEDSMLKLNTGIDADGHVGIQGADYVRYIPGHEAYAFFTCVFASPLVDFNHKIGLFDYDGGNGNGFFIGYNGLDFGITRRRAGVDIFTAVDPAGVFPVAAGVFDPTKGNVYKISFGYLGFAPITFEVMLPDRSFTDLAVIQYPNTSIETHIANTNIPLRAEMTNTGSVIDSQMKIGSVSAGIVDGGGADPIARWFSQRSPEVAVTSGISQVIAFRNKSVFFGITNKITSQLMRISGSTEGTKPVAFFMKKNPVELVPGTWTDADPDSVIEVSGNVEFDPATGVELLDFDLSKNDGLFERVDEENIKLRPNETAVLFVETTGLSDVRFSIRYKDLF